MTACGTRLLDWRAVSEKFGLQGGPAAWYERLREIVVLPRSPREQGWLAMFASLVKDAYVGEPDFAHKHKIGEVIIQSKGKGERKLVLHLVNDVDDHSITTSACEWRHENWEGGDFTFLPIEQRTTEIREMQRNAHRYLTLDRLSPHHLAPANTVHTLDRARGVLVLQKGMAQAARAQLGRCGKAHVLRTHGGDNNLSEDSPPDDTDQETSGPREEHNFDTVSDGSLHDFQTLKGYMAGAAAVGLGDNGHVQVVRKNIPNRVAWTTDNTCTTYDPVHPSSFTIEAEGVCLALSKLERSKRGESDRHACDNEGVIKRLNGKMPADMRGHIRSEAKYATRAVRSRMKESQGEVTMQWTRGHMGVWAQEKADRHAGRVAFRHCVERPPRYPEDDKITHHVYYGEHIVHGDIRTHSIAVARARYVSDWCSKPSQGALLRDASAKKRKPLPKHVGPKTPRWVTSFNSAFVTNTLTTPAMNRSGGTECPLCGHGKADLKHVMMDCGHHKMVEMRRAMGAKLEPLLKASPHVHAIRGKYAPHPITYVPKGNLYPYAEGYPNDAGNGEDKYALDGLPEGRWYRVSKRPGSITVYYPGNRLHPTGWAEADARLQRMFLAACGVAPGYDVWRANAKRFLRRPGEGHIPCGRDELRHFR